MTPASDKLFIGLMSGTSLDGIDAILMEFSNPMKTLATKFCPFSDNLYQQLKSLTQAGENEVHRMAIAEQQLAIEYAHTVQALLEHANIKATDISAIGVHGQTIRHCASLHDQPGYSVQLIDPAKLAVETGITVVADFRRKDIALGGQGAPLVPAFHHYAFADKQIDRALINIGGIANLTFLGSNSNTAKGYDLGPGNTLLDHWFQQHQKGQFDHNGNWARGGTINKPLLNSLLDDNYFSQEPPKSTGPEYFNVNWLEQYLSHFDSISVLDIQTTLTELTAISICDGIKNIMQGTQTEIYLCGGGCHNQYLVERIGLHLKQNVVTTRVLGLDPDQVEAAAFAWLAMQRLNQQTGNMMSATGASREAILGGVYLPQ